MIPYSECVERTELKDFLIQPLSMSNFVLNYTFFTEYEKIFSSTYVTVKEITDMDDFKRLFG